LGRPHYGDKCSNPRAGALKKVKNGDVLLFWGLLWKNSGSDWSAFSGESGWYLLGALRVEEIATPGQRLDQVSKHNRPRAGRNSHFARGVLKKDNWVFLGAFRYSTRFSRPVDLAVTSPSGLMYSAFTSAAGELLASSGRPSWRSSLRSCRKIWDLRDPAARARAELVREAIRTSTGFDLLEDV
jgi:hypothetical protein